jgi:hypothetical protein
MSLKTRPEIPCSVGMLRNLQALEPDSDFIAVLPNQLESFTDKAAILISVADLRVHIKQLTTMHIEGVAESAA